MFHNVPDATELKRVCLSIQVHFQPQSSEFFGICYLIEGYLYGSREGSNILD